MVNQIGMNSRKEIWKMNADVNKRGFAECKTSL